MKPVETGDTKLQPRLCWLGESINLHEKTVIVGSSYQFVIFFSDIAVQGCPEPFFSYLSIFL